MADFRREMFHVQHLKLMDLRPIDEEILFKLDGVRFNLQKAQENGLAMTLMYDGRVVACMGFFELMPGVAEGWILPSIYVKNIPKLFAREVKWYIKQMAKTFQWHRVQTISRPDAVDQRWMQFLGFEQEGVMKKYCQKQDFILSAQYFD